MPRGEPKVMFAVRLPGAMREAIRERAQDDGVTEAELLERWIELGLEDSNGRSETGSVV